MWTDDRIRKWVSAATKRLAAGEDTRAPALVAAAALCLSPFAFDPAFFNLHGANTYWHPITWLSHMLDVQLFGVSARAHHFINLGSKRTRGGSIRRACLPINWIK
jgi:hypothetical protein